MTTPPPQPIREKSNRELWLVVRRALVMVIRAFDEHFGVEGDHSKRIA